MYRDGGEIVPGQDWFSFGWESGSLGRADCIGRKERCRCGSRIGGRERKGFRRAREDEGGEVGSRALRIFGLTGIEKVYRVYFYATAAPGLRFVFCACI